MKVIIDSLCNKKIKYKIFGAKGKERELKGKGRFIRHLGCDIEPQSEQIIVRITRKVSIWSAIYVWLVNVFLLETLIEGIAYAPKLNKIWEIRINNISNAEAIHITYTDSKPEISKHSDSDKKLGESDVLYCTSHPFQRETAWLNKREWLLFVFYIFSLTAIAAVVFLLIYFLCIDLL